MEIKEFFEPVLSFIKGFQKKDKEPASKQAAKDRLKLVLMQDRASVSPDFFELMKQEIIDVIKKYIEIDEESLEVELARGFESGLEGPALYANIPIKNVKPVAPKSEESAALSEEEADRLADQILDNIEEVAGKSEKEEAAGKSVEDVSSKDEGGAKVEVEVAQNSDVEGEIAPNLIGVISPESEELIRRVLKEDQETSEDSKVEEVSGEVEEKTENEKGEDEKVEEVVSTTTTDEEKTKPKKTSTKKSTSSKTSKTTKTTTRKKKSE